MTLRNTPKSKLRLVSEFGHKVRALRLSRGLSQSQVAEGSPFTWVLVNRVETGLARVISADQVRAFAAKLGVDEDDLWQLIPGGKQEGRFIALLEQEKR